MEGHWFLIWLILRIFSLKALASTSLIERIRQSEENNKMKGLDLTAEGWVHVPQSLQDVLASIDDKLRSLDTLGYTLKLAKFDFSLEQLVRRLDSIETKLGRLETKFDVRMEKVEEIVIGKDLKEEFSNEHLSRRMDFLNDKLNNKVAYLDAKIDLKMETITAKLDTLERDLHSSVDDILEKLVKSDDRQSQFETLVIGKFKKVDDVATSVNDLRLFLKEELVNILQKRMEKVDHNIEGLNNEVKQTGERTFAANSAIVRANDRLDVVLRDLKYGLRNITARCGTGETVRSLLPPCESSNTNHDQILEAVTSIVQKSVKSKEDMFTKLETSLEVYAKKTIASTQELRRISEENKSLLLRIIETSNRSRDFIRQEFRDRLEQTSRCENKLSRMGSELEKKVSELMSTVDTSFATLLVAQNTFISSCRRIQQEEAQVYEILQQIVYEMRNRSMADVYKISNEIRQSKDELGASVLHLFEVLFVVGNNTISQLENYHRKMCGSVGRSYNSVSSASADSKDQTTNNTQTYYLPEESNDDANDFLDITNDTELGRSVEDNRTISAMNDYENDYPITDTDYNDVQQEFDV